ncbi:MMPL family transporter [Marihabitans asiaticum]|uniref:RND superfamily putative drug exporter n=1 Tax=Marihabitans asiaticum TaxID=415218 RepID=A0A560WG30_9MICO|nr:MMPL family transporter [Marihabitans asiaticum]TWD16639.1 RND superfamily putative drug exporter [Marihabitans asiaticum]
MQRLAAFVTNARTAWIVIVVALIASGAFFGLGQGERLPSPTETMPVGADSTTARELAEELPQADDGTAIVLFESQDGPLSRDQLESIGTLASQIGAEGGEGGRPPFAPSEDGQAAIVVVPVDGETSTEQNEAVTALRDQLREQSPDGVSTGVTGPAAISGDLAAVFEGADFRLLAATAAVVAILLLVTYRSPILWIFPLLVIGTGDRVASILATRGLNAAGVAWDESVTGIISVLVFGAGTNYALLLISRYRDELRTREDRREALRVALTRTAHAVLSSATTVVVGVLTLMLSAFPATRGLGLGSAIGIVIAVIYALIVLPAVLSYLGRWVFWPKVPRTDQAALSEHRTVWRRIGDTVARRPGAFVAGTLVALAVAAIGVSQMRLGLPEAEQFLDTPDSIATAQRLGDHFPAGSVQPTTIVTKGDAQEITDVASGVGGVDSVRPSSAAEDGSLTSLQVILAEDPDSDAAQQTVRDLRAALAPFDETYVGGATAEALDADEAHAGDRWLIMPLALVLVLVALMLLLRSIAAPIILVLTVLATFAASLGLSWWIFTEILGFTALGSNAPLYAFLFLVALGVDYNIFLVTRALEERGEHGTREGMLRALAATGGVITSAGILLAAVFAVLGVLPLVVLAQVGTIICVGVLLDTLLVRTVLVPAIALTLGDRFWWPRQA